MKSVLLAALLSEWACRLGTAIEKLETDLPLERQYTTTQVYNGPGPFGLNLDFSVNPKTRPELYREIKTPQPFQELDDLRDILDCVNDVIDSLRSPQQTEAAGEGAEVE